MQTDEIALGSKCTDMSNSCCEETIEEKASRNSLRFSVNKLLLLLIKVLVMSPFLFASVHRAFKIHLSNRNSASKDPEYIGNF